MMNYTSTMTDMQKQMGAFVEPFRAVNGKLFEHWEKMADYQLDMARRYTDVTIGQLREATEIQTPEQLQSYVQKGTEAVRETTDSLTKDARTMVEMTQAMTEDLQKTVRESATQRN